MPQRFAFGMWRRVLPGVFLVCALPLLLFLAIRVPTGETPDEVAHIVRMESLLHGQWVGHRRPWTDALGNPVADSGVLANGALLAAGFSFQPGTPIGERTLTRVRLQALAAIPWDPAPSFVSIPNTGVYAPVFYMPGAVAMQAAKWLGHGPWVAIKVARLGNAALYLAAGLVALLAARRLQGLLFAALMLPMSLWLAASANQDGLVIAAAVLSAALLTRGTMRAWWGAVACFALVALAKPPYVPLAAVLLVLAPVRGWALRLRVAGGICATAPALGWFVYGQARAAVPFVRGVFKAGPYWPGDAGQMFGQVDPALQVRVLLHQPSLLFRLPYELFAYHSAYLHWEMIGVLGTLDLLLPTAVYTAWGWALVALAVGETLRSRGELPGAGAAQGAAKRAMVAVCVLGAVGVLCVGQYVSWTFTGAAVVESVQGRYLLPLLGFAALALPWLGVPGGAAGRWILRLPAVALAVAGLAIIPGVVVSTYYLR